MPVNLGLKRQDSIPDPEDIMPEVKKSFTMPIIFPRKYQLGSWKAYHNGIKNLVVSYPRRHGKDVVSLSIAVDYAMANPGTSVVLLAPTKVWAKRIYWKKGQSLVVTDPFTGKVTTRIGSLLDVCVPEELRLKTLVNEACIYLKNGSTIELQGSDDQEFVGQKINCVVISETARHKPETFPLLSPVLEEAQGLTIYNGTVEDDTNHFWNLIENIRDLDTWNLDYKTLEDTKTAYYLPEKDENGLIEFIVNGELIGKNSPLTGIPYTNIYSKVKAGEPKAFVIREYLNIPTNIEEGSYYEEILSSLRNQGLISDAVVFNADLPVHCAVDLGVSDDTTIVWYQWLDDTLIFVDCYSNNGKDIGHYIDIIRSKPYKLGCCFAPHDVSKRSLSDGLNLIDYCRREHNFVFSYIPKTNSVIGDINVCRAYLQKAQFIRNSTKDLISSLQAYRENVVTGKPVHDKHSHFADSFRYAVVSIHKSLLQVNALMQLDPPTRRNSRDKIQKTTEESSSAGAFFSGGLVRNVEDIQYMNGLTYNIE